ncbi:hypothetical protein [Rhodococcus sp. RDE2]|uniref:hypothetical protein n=1 Tax=Rhodococcus sp. RDE2 TaxID=2885078 RepID=UPI001E4B2547|nr:hypothetical protein [Rhodococcus sp. RDE2]BDB60884.1 hypothetical protein RDE2_26780 [Rhodococcus sp. RDE2]
MGGDLGFGADNPDAADRRPDPQIRAVVALRRIVRRVVRRALFTHASCDVRTGPHDALPTLDLPRIPPCPIRGARSAPFGLLSPWPARTAAWCRFAASGARYDLPGPPPSSPACLSAQPS